MGRRCAAASPCAAGDDNWREGDIHIAPQPTDSLEFFSSTEFRYPKKYPKESD